MNTNSEIDIKIRNNAMSAYFLIFLCGTFLFVKHNPNVDHPFVKSHTKTALFLHTLILLLIAIFLWFGLFSSLSWNEYHLNSILASISLIGVLGFLLKGMYTAHNGELFTIGEIAHFVKTEKIVDIHQGVNIVEEDKATIIFSMIPFLGYIIYGKYPNNSIVKHLSHLNLLITLVISFIYIYGYANAANLLLLVGVIGIVFLSIQIVIKGEVMSIDMTQIPSFEELYENIKISFFYLKKYLGKEKFTNWNDLKEERKNQVISDSCHSCEGRNLSTVKKSLFQEQEEKNQKNMKLPKWLIYLPIVNLITLFDLQSNKRIHITNGLGITFLFIIASTIILYDPSYLFFFLFPMTYGYAFLETNPNYKLPLFYDVGNGTIILFKKIKKFFIRAHEIKNTENIISLKVEEKK